MNRFLLTLVLLFFAATGFARHLKGGFFTYTYVSKTSTDIRYNIVLTLYMECNASGRQIDDQASFTFFDGLTSQYLFVQAVAKTSEYLLTKDQDEECIAGDQRGCYYKIVTYELNGVDLPIRANGYTVSYQRCCRINGINNISNSGEIGNTYSITIPGTTSTYETNSSARFLINDTYVVCGSSKFEFPFQATDPDSDELRYSFCDAWGGASANDPAPTRATAPPYGVVPYTSGFGGDEPLGNRVTIDSKTGIVSGFAPSNPGEYVVTVCVDEYKDGIKKATTRKELHLVVGDCVPIQAALDPSYITCDGYTMTFQNNTPSNDIKTYLWEFGNGQTSAEAIPTITYSDTGSYAVKLTVNKGQLCENSATTVAKVYPGFFPDFTFAGICVGKPTKFSDQTKAAYGFVNSWSWDFGNTATSTDVSKLQNPTYTYSAVGTYNVRLIATSSKGCSADTIKQITIIDKPPITLRFKDTLICNGDALQLNASGSGIFSWTPTGADIVNANTATPTVTPMATKKYYVQLDDNGCLNRDSVRVRVVDFVTLKARNDTTICTTDSVQLNAVSDGLQFTWNPASSLNNPNIINPLAAPPGTTTYTVLARIGHCTASDDVVVLTVPYPGVNAGPDTLICFGTTAQLNGSMIGSSFSWSPTSTLTNYNTLSPIANPIGTTTYTLTVRDTIGCPKPSRDNVVVKVLPKIRAFAGNDTAVVVGQPLQFMATGGVKYQWSPATWLNKTDIPNPVAIYSEDVQDITYKVDVYNEANCVDSAFVTVKVFKTNPQVFVPTAFTPNGDGSNDVFRPIAVGISRIEYFRVFNRWGEQVFYTTTNGKGWDGRIGGKEQGTGVFVWLVKGVDYTGKSFFAKGTVTLIR